VVPVSGDYTAAMVTNAVDRTGSYANPAWIASLPWSKITGAPSVGSYQTPWLQDINGASFNLNSVKAIGIGGNASSSLLSLTKNSATVGGTDAGILNLNAAGSALWGASISSYYFMIGVIGPSSPSYTPGVMIQSQNCPIVFYTDAAEKMRLTESGLLGIGYQNPQAMLDCAGLIRTSGGTNPTSGAGIEISYQSSNGYILSYDRGASAFKPISIQGSPITLIGNVGIGTSNPTVLLQVGPNTLHTWDSSQVALPAAIYFAGYSATAPWSILSAYDGTNSIGFLFRTSVSGTQYDRMAITSTGYVGIGTNSPQANLDVAGFIRSTALGNVPTSGQGVELYMNAGSGNLTSFDRGAGGFYPLQIQGSGIYMNPSGGAVGVGVGNGLTLLNTLDVRGGIICTQGFQINATYNGSIGWTPVISGSGCYLAFSGNYLNLYVSTNSTTPGTAFSGFANIFSISAIAVGIGGITPLAQLHVVNDARFGTGAVTASPGDIGVSRNGGATSGVVYFGNSTSQYIYFTGSTWAFSPATGGLPSDLRLKQNVRTLTGGLDVINQLRPVEAEWGPAAKVNVGQRLVSLIAQEVQKVLPECVTAVRGPNPGDEEYLHFTPNEILMHLILAVQQLSRGVN